MVKKPIDHIEFQLETKPAYTLPSDAVILLTAYFGDVSIKGDVRPLKIIPEEALREIFPSWLDENSGSRGVPQYVTLIDRTTVLVTPTPDANASASGKKLHIGYCYQPAILTSDSDSIDLPIVYHDLVSQYAAHLCWLTKLAKPEIGIALIGQMMEKAKKLEELIVKDSVSFGFSWGGFLNIENDSPFRVNP